MPAFRDAFCLENFGGVMGGFSSQLKVPSLHKLGCILSEFEQNWIFFIMKLVN